MLKRNSRLLLILLIFGFIQRGYSQTGYRWARSIGGPNYSEFGLDVTTDRFGNVYLVGEYLNGALIGDSIYNSLGDNDMFLAKYDPDGNSLWVRVQGSAQLDRIYGVDVGADDHIYIAGYGKIIYPSRVAAPLHARDGLVARYRPNGDMVWGHNLDGDIFSEFQDVIGDADGNCYAVGTMETTTWLGNDTLVGNGGRDGYMIKFDSLGNYVWGLTFGGPLADHPWALGHDAQDNLLIGGQYSGTATMGGGTVTAAGDTDAFITKYDKNGSGIWTRSFGGPAEDIILALKASPDGDIYFAGQYDNYIVYQSDTLFSASITDIFYGKMDAAGNLIWWKSAGGLGLDVPQDLEIDTEENIYIGGYFFGNLTFDTAFTTSAGYDDLYFTKLDSNGNMLFFETSHYPDTRDVFGLGVDAAQNLIITGSYLPQIELGNDTLHSVSGSVDIFLTKYVTENLQVTLDSVTGSPFCGGDEFFLHYSVLGDLDSANVLYAELSNASGSFSQPDTIGTQASRFGGILNCTIPLGLPAGTGYRLRIATDQPGFITPDNGYDITLDPSTAIPVQIIGDSILCNGIPVQLQIAQGFQSQHWSTGDTTYSIVALLPGLYTVEATDSSGCSNRDEIQVMSCVAISQTLTKPNFRAYPNPTQEVLNLEGKGQGQWQLSLTDLAGKTVWKMEFAA
ncbi:MAG TPA: hypothetical protein ENJ82_07200, partial [Bacteroidetes bacterium]|nr:hypothetical protein [Bacteroidota bacterium]